MQQQAIRGFPLTSYNHTLQQNCFMFEHLLFNPYAVFTLEHHMSLFRGCALLLPQLILSYSCWQGCA